MMPVCNNINIMIILQGLYYPQSYKTMQMTVEETTLGYSLVLSSNKTII